MLKLIPQQTIPQITQILHTSMSGEKNTYFHTGERLYVDLWGRVGVKTDDTIMETLRDIFHFRRYNPEVVTKALRDRLITDFARLENRDQIRQFQEIFPVLDKLKIRLEERSDIESKTKQNSIQNLVSLGDEKNDVGPLCQFCASPIFTTVLRIIRKVECEEQDIESARREIAADIIRHENVDYIQYLKDNFDKTKVDLLIEALISDVETKLQEYERNKIEAEVLDDTVAEEDPLQSLEEELSQGRVINDDKRDIRDLLNHIATARIAPNPSYCEGIKSKIKDLHTFLYLVYVFTDKTKIEATGMTNADNFSNIRKFKIGGFFSNAIGKNLTELHKAGKLLPYVDRFAKIVRADPNVIRGFVETQDWNKLFDHLEKIHKGEIAPYTPVKRRANVGATVINMPVAVGAEEIVEDDLPKSNPLCNRSYVAIAAAVAVAAIPVIYIAASYLI